MFIFLGFGEYAETKMLENIIINWELTVFLFQILIS